eukprot:TRINITY_DN32197_c0_g1_i2.p1 TRINITY_DN32197_c0_g1~~TRINITY_DN32197_c0_g1_i2.p1  ORF type:complete len:343 (-),score=87.85 TRINITY_DN32197_c0_g1_i2:67-1095(-)
MTRSGQSSKAAGNDVLQLITECNQRQWQRHLVRKKHSQEQQPKQLERSASGSVGSSKGFLPQLGCQKRQLTRSRSSTGGTLPRGKQGNFAAWGSPEQSPEQQLQKQLNMMPQWEHLEKREVISGCFFSALASPRKAGTCSANDLAEWSLQDWGSPEQSPEKQLQKQLSLISSWKSQPDNLNQESDPDVDLIANCFAGALLMSPAKAAARLLSQPGASPCNADLEQPSPQECKYADWESPGESPEKHLLEEAFAKKPASKGKEADLQGLDDASTRAPSRDSAWPFSVACSRAGSRTGSRTGKRVESGSSGHDSGRMQLASVAAASRPPRPKSLTQDSGPGISA